MSTSGLPRAPALKRRQREAGRAVEIPGALDVTNFTRYQARIQFGLEF
jgi:hypothetical protein